MIIERETSRYEVSPQTLIENSFTGAYNNASDAPVITKPDLSVTIFGCISMLLIFGMCLLTAVQKGAKVWYFIGAAFLLLIFYIVSKHMKKLKIYRDANSQGTQKYDYRAEYLSLFPQNLPAKMPASEMARELAPLQGKQKKDIYNNAIRDLISSLNARNNPNDIMCKNISLYGALMSQTKRRYYLRSEEGKIVIYDADFMNPRGELVCDASDVLSYGPFSSYPSKINTSGSKINQDSIIIEIQTGEGENDRLYLEVHGMEAERVQKLLGSKKKNH